MMTVPTYWARAPGESDDYSQKSALRWLYAEDLVASWL